MTQPSDLRSAFYDSVLRRQIAGSSADVTAFVDAWKMATNADWVWLWLRNDVSNRWELVCTSDSLFLPPTNTFATGGCAGDFAIAKQEALISYPIPGPSLEIDGHKYQAKFQEWLQQQLCSSIDVVPLMSTPNNIPTNPFLDLKIFGMIALHYKRGTTRVDHQLRALTRMGAMTTHALLRSYREKQLSVLFKLNELQAEFLPKSGKPSTTRARYVRKLIDLIAQEVNCHAVSIFYERRWSSKAFCLGTTGLLNRAKNQIISSAQVMDENKPIRIAYHLDEKTWTSSSIVNGQPYIRLANEEIPQHVGTYIEAPNGRILKHRALLLMPIPRVDGDVSGSSPRSVACGVIRCSGHFASNLPHEDRDFDPLDVQKIAFIAMQISPVLETFASRITREKAIEVLKHDLQIPLMMMRDGLNRAEKSPTNESISIDRQEFKVRGYDLKNMQYAVLFSRGLVEQLDADPQNIRPLNPSKVFLEGDVIARLKNLMGQYAQIEKKIEIVFGDFRGSSDGVVLPIPPLCADRDLVERVFSNLLSNAIKYGAEKSKIHIDPRIENDGLHVWISNYGIGITPEEAELIFDPYYRTPKAEQMAQGAGLGLGIAQKIMQSHEGNVTLVRLDDPTIFDVFFPEKLFL